MKSFEEYLKDKCFEEHPIYFGNEMPDFSNDNMVGFFDNWLEEQNIQSILIYSEGWGRHIKNTILKEITNLTK